MKKIIVVAVSLIVAISASAQVQWGVTAGMGFNTSKFNEIDVKAKAGWNLGLTLNADLPLGFSIQPSLVYHQKGVNLTDDVSQNMGYIELPVSVQWGPDLVLFRPFLDVTPYIGYALSNKLTVDSALAAFDDRSWAGKQRFEYGVGIGAGVNVWKLQLIARYNWNFGHLYENATWEEIQTLAPELNTGSRNFGGVTIQLAYFF